LDNGLHGYDPTTGKLNLMVHAEPDEPGNRYNDGRCDRRGRLWIGTMDIGIRRASGSFYRIGADRGVLRLFDGITVPNSTAFSPDDRTLYFADTPRHVIWAFDFNLHAGMIGERRVFADLTARNGFPDGSCIDAEGFLWNAEYGGHRLTRYAPDGRTDRTIELPVTNPTCCCFGGDNLDTLYVTSAMPAPKPGRESGAMEGALLALTVGVRGLPEAAFGG
jgi:sugar lactone lactonase YvrE